MIYFDNAATSGHKPQQVIDAMVGAVNQLGSPSRGGYSSALENSRMVLSARMALATLFGCPNPLRVIFTQNVTIALNIAIGGVDGHIVTTAAEHNSVLRPIYQKGNHTIVSLNAKGAVSFDAIKSALRDDTKAIVLAHGSNITGNVTELMPIGRLCKERGILFIVDTAQTAGMIPLNMENLGISALCFTGHKGLYGPRGIGGLCLAEGFNPPPLYVGGTGSNSFSTSHPTDYPDALEAGTPNTPGIAGLLAGVKYVTSLGLDTIRQQGNHLANTFVEGLSHNRKIVFYGDLTATPRTPIVSLNIMGKSADEVADLLDEEYEIAVRVGAHCAPLMHKALGTDGTGLIRFSFSHLNTMEEIQTGIRAINEISNN